MLKLIHTCDKCGNEETTESIKNNQIGPIPKNWTMPEIQSRDDWKADIRILLCKECSDKAGFGDNSQPLGSMEEQRTSAEKLIDILFKLAEERGVFNGK